eukprot:7378433-Pyramimonas_sp.AAC.1
MFRAALPTAPLDVSEMRRCYEKSHGLQILTPAMLLAIARAGKSGRLMWTSRRLTRVTFAFLPPSPSITILSIVMELLVLTDGRQESSRYCD